MKNSPGSTLICERLSEVSAQQIKDKHLKKATLAKEAKNPDALFQASLYRVNGTYGFPAAGFKKSMVNAANEAGMEMTKARKDFFVMGDIIPFTKCSKPRMRENDFPVIAYGKRDWRIRGEFEEWEAELPILFNANVISAEQIINLLDNAGIHCGIGGWRPFAPHSTGNHGMFEVVRKQEKTIGSRAP